MIVKLHQLFQPCFVIEFLNSHFIILKNVFRGVTGYLKKLKEFLSSPAGKKTDSEDVKIKEMALRSTQNLQVQINFLTTFFLTKKIVKIQQKI